MEIPADIISNLFLYITCFNLRATCKHSKNIISKNAVFKEKMCLLDEALKFMKKSTLSVRYCNMLIMKSNTHAATPIRVTDSVNIVNDDVLYKTHRIQCHACLKKNGLRCNHKAINGTLFCGIHKKNSKCYWMCANNSESRVDCIKFVDIITSSFFVGNLTYNSLFKLQVCSSKLNSRLKRDAIFAKKDINVYTWSRQDNQIVLIWGLGWNHNTFESWMNEKEEHDCIDSEHEKGVTRVECNELLCQDDLLFEVLEDIYGTWNHITGKRTKGPHIRSCPDTTASYYV